jgi:hypothetical protein
MPDRQKFTSLTLRTYSEALRRDLYDAVVLHVWTPTAPGDYVPPYTPDAAQLTVMYTHGRWIAIWIELDEPADAPPDQRASMCRIMADPDQPFGIQLSEV